MAGDNKPIVFGGAAAGRIAQAVRVVERATQGGDGRGRRRIPVYTGGSAWVFAKTGLSGIPARTGSVPSNLTPGVATCSVYEWVASASALVLNSANTLAVRNPWAGSVGPSKLITADANAGGWWVRQEDCG